MTQRSVGTESRATQIVLILLALAFLAFFLLLPLVSVFSEALKQGIAPFLDAVSNPDALAAIRLTLFIAAISVPLNLVFGITASWAITKFSFPGKNLLLTPVSYTHLTLPTKA